MNAEPQDATHETPNAKYERGVDLFNRGEHFDAHEVWEELWLECPAAERRFVQALIQAAVAVYHFHRDNRAGAARLFRSGKKYMGPYRPCTVGSTWTDSGGKWNCTSPRASDNSGTAGPRPVIALFQAPAGCRHERPDDLADFKGTARLFPLPNLVLFPQVVQGLHIFEPRYRQLMADALDTDRSSRSSSSSRDGRKNTTGRRRSVVACLGRVTWHEAPGWPLHLRLRGGPRADRRETRPTGCTGSPAGGYADRCDRPRHAGTHARSGGVVLPRFEDGRPAGS